MDKKQPLLSICIPTYNRGDILKKALSSYLVCVGFDEDVEIIISDNCSTDNTQCICEEFVSKYPNIKYFRNEKNIIDSNFPLALDRGSGKYLKLMNDSHIVNKDFLIYLKTCLKNEINSKCPVFFTFGVLFNHVKIDRVYCHNFDDYLRYISFFVTANQLFGVWKEDWKIVKDRLKYTKLRLNQVDWTFQILSLNKEVVLYTGSGFQLENVGARSGYNWFEVHVANYYTIMQPYIINEQISSKGLSGEKRTHLKGLKKQIFRAYIYNEDPNWKFDYSGTTKVLWKNFHDQWYFYFFILISPIWMLKIFINIIKKK